MNNGALFKYILKISLVATIFFPAFGIAKASIKEMVIFNCVCTDDECTPKPPAIKGLW